MPSKQLHFSEAARTSIKRGVDLLAKLIGVTLGPKGRNVLLDRSGHSATPQIVKDGVSIAKEIDLEDPDENLGAEMMREIAEKTSEDVGDGTSTAIVLAASILANGYRNVTAGANPMALKRGIDKAIETVTEAIEKSAKQIKESDELRAVATVSANHDSVIGKLIADAMKEVGRDGVITVEESKGTSTNLKIVEGMQFTRGYLSAHFVTDHERMEIVLKDPLILLFEKKISAIHEFVPFLEKVAQIGKPLLIISEDVEGEALAALVVNKLRGLLNVVAVKAPGFGDSRKAVMTDIATLTGGSFFSEELGTKLDAIETNELGRAARIVVTKDDTTIIEGAGTKKAINERCQHIQKEIERSESSYDQEKLKERLAKLKGGVAVIEVGASTESEMKEKKSRVDNALNAARAASEAGIVPGGGVAFLRAISSLKELSLKGDEQTGVSIVTEALLSPARKIAENAGFSGDVVVNRILEGKGSFGFNAVTGEYEDLTKANVIDPAKVNITSLRNAASIASLILTTEATITDTPEEKKVAKATK